MKTDSLIISVAGVLTNGGYYTSANLAAKLGAKRRAINRALEKLVFERFAIRSELKNGNLDKTYLYSHIEGALLNLERPKKRTIKQVVLQAICDLETDDRRKIADKTGLDILQIKNAFWLLSRSGDIRINEFGGWEVIKPEKSMSVDSNSKVRVITFPDNWKPQPALRVVVNPQSSYEYG
jgi:hypothetical protein